FGREAEIDRLISLLVPGNSVERGAFSVGGDDAGVRAQHSTAQRAPDTQHSPRLITLTGPGGSGKTRVALEAAARLNEAFKGAARFVALADLRDPARIADAIADALLLEPASEGSRLEQVALALARPPDGSPALLVLDNVEQLLRPGDGDD